MLRVPVALAMVKLLQALPRRSLQQHLPGLLPKVCQALRSRAQDLWDIGRDVLVKILASLGTGYLPFILKELRHVLTRGYQMGPSRRNRLRKVEQEEEGEGQQGKVGCDRGP